MNFKIDTKEKFTVIELLETVLTANLADELDQLILPYQKKETPHLVVNMKAVQEIDDIIAEKVASLQQAFYDDNHSLVICCLQNKVEKAFESLDLLETLNVTPSESEAWDIVQMEEIERELMDDTDY